MARWEWALRKDLNEEKERSMKRIGWWCVVSIFVSLFHVATRGTPLASVGRRSYRRQIANAILCGLSIFFSGIATAWCADGPNWIFNRAASEASPECTVGQGVLIREVGMTTIQPLGTDLTLSFPLRDHDRFEASESPFFALRYRANTSQRQGGLFFTSDLLPDLSDASYSAFPVVGDGNYHNIVVDMRSFPHGNWKGRIQFFRLDPTNPSDTDSTIQISRFGFFATEESANAFLAAADDRPDYSQETVFRAAFQKVTVPGGVLSDGYRREDFLLQDTTPVGGWREPRRELPRPVVVYTDSQGNREILADATVNALGFVRYTAHKPGTYTLEYVDPSLVPQNTTASDSTTSDSAASSYPPEFFTRKRIKIGSWANFDPKKVDRQYVKDYADAGFDWIIALSAVTQPPYREPFLQWCHELGIETYVNDGAYQNPLVDTAEYFDEPSFTGHYITDEPGSDDFDRLAEICNRYAEQTGKVPYINLLPMYANAAQFKYGAGAAAIEYYDADPALFRKYCEAFCEKFDTHYICTDIYPLNWVDGRKVTYADYIESIHVIAEVARRYDREFWCYIQTYSWTPSKRTPNEIEYRWQCYSMLSFGCTGLLCWQWGGTSPEFPSLVDVESQKTPTYYDAKTVFQEIRKISDEFVKYRYLGSFNHGCTESTPYLRMSDPYTEFHDVIQEIDCDDPLLFGCFEEQKKTTDTTSQTSSEPSHAFTMVNMSELQDAKTITVRLKLAAERVTAYPRGVATVLVPQDGWYTFTLPTGEGVFVTVATNGSGVPPTAR